MPRPKKSLSEAISKELKSGFNLDSFKDKRIKCYYSKKFKFFVRQEL